MLHISVQNEVTLLKVPGHKGIAGNDRADKLANIGSDSLPIGPEPFIYYNLNSILKEIEEILLKKQIKKTKDKTYKRNIQNTSIKLP